MNHEIQKVKDFVIAGNALFTIENTQTGNRFTFKVKKPKHGENKERIRFVSLLNGPDNYSNYCYLGCIYNMGQFKLTKGSKVKPSAQSVKVFSWFWKHVENLPANVKVYHEGRCGRCGRRLTVPVSIQSGFGPECINHL